MVGTLLENQVKNDKDVDIARNPIWKSWFLKNLRKKIKKKSTKNFIQLF